MSQIYSEVDQNDLRRVMSKLKDMEKAPRHLRNAINRTATVAMRMIKQGRSKGYTVKTGRFNQDLGKIRLLNPGTIGDEKHPTFALLEIADGDVVCRILDYEEEEP